MKRLSAHPMHNSAPRPEAVSSNILGNLLYYRTKNSACLTDNAAEADVFMIPLFLAKKTHDQWVDKCRLFSRQEGPWHLVQKLRHLTPETAIRHVLPNVKNLKDFRVGTT